MKKKTYDIYDEKLIRDTWRNVTRPRFNLVVNQAEATGLERVTRDDGTTVLAMVPPTEAQLRVRYSVGLENEIGEDHIDNLAVPSAISRARLKLAMQLADLRAAAPRDRPAGGDQTPEAWDPDGEALADLDNPMPFTSGEPRMVGACVGRELTKDELAEIAPADPIAASRKRGAK